MSAIWAWIAANPAFATAIGVALYALLTKKITLSGFINQIIHDFLVAIGKKDPNVPVVTPPVDPVNPVVDPVPQFDVSTLLQLLIPLLLKAKASGDKESEEAVLKVMATCPHCKLGD